MASRGRGRGKPSGRPLPGARRPVNRDSSLSQQFGSMNLGPNISHTPIFSTAPPRTPPPGQPSASDWESYTASQREQKQADAWRELSKTWEQWPDFEKSWEGVRHLGKGGAGSAHLFRNIRSDESTEGMPEYIVVKEAGGSDKDLLSESMFLQLFMDRNTPHVLKIYRGYHEGEVVPPNIGGMFDVGRENFQRRQKRVHSRIYLEFCEKGDVENWADKSSIVLEERVIWDIFECLARACLMLETGTESSETGTGQGWTPICHLDLKPANILIGNKDDNHDEIGIFKMGDFGLAAHVPNNPQDPGWLVHVAENLTLGWGAPEQFFPQMQNRSYSTPANVFGVAAIVYYIMTKQPVEIGQGMAYVGFPSLDTDPNINPKPPILTCGRSLLDNATINNSGIYSKALIRTLLQCLAYSPDKRMTAKQLLDVCTQGRFMSEPVLEEYTYESSQPATNYWPTASPQAMTDYQSAKEIMKYHPTPESIAEAKEREETFLASFWVKYPIQIEPPLSTNTFGSIPNFGSIERPSTTFNFGQQPSSSQFGSSNMFQPDNGTSGISTPGNRFMFGQQPSSSQFNISNNPGGGFQFGQ